MTIKSKLECVKLSLEGGNWLLSLSMYWQSCSTPVTTLSVQDNSNVHNSSNNGMCIVYIQALVATLATAAAEHWPVSY